MSKRIILILAVVILTVSGCAAPPPETVDIESFDDTVSTEQIVSLVDKDLKIVPDNTFYILMEENFDAERQVLLRRSIKYDGIQNAVTEIVSEINFTRSFVRGKDAKEWLKLTAPAKLMLQPKTYLNENVLAQWEQEEYDYSLERRSQISLDGLKRLGAISRLNEVFVIKHHGEQLQELIAKIEQDSLPRHANLRVEQVVEIFPQAFNYSLNIALFNEPINKPSNLIITTTMDFYYSVDEFGNPVEFKLNTYFENFEEKTPLMLLPVVNDMAVFAWTLRAALVEEFDLYGVQLYNPTLQYANVTLHYESTESENRYTEQFSIR